VKQETTITLGIVFAPINLLKNLTQKNILVFLANSKIVSTIVS